MTETEEKTSTETPTKGKPGRKLGTRKGGKGKKYPAYPRKAKPGRGAQSFVEAVNSVLSVDSGEIAIKLSEKAKTGDVPCSRFLRQVADESIPPVSDHNPEIAALNLPNPEALAAEPQWVDPELGSVWVGDHWENAETAPDALARTRNTREMAARRNPHLSPDDNPAAGS